MELRADSDGFLIGSQRVDLSSERDKLQILRAIKADTAAMRKALGSDAAPQLPPATPPATAPAMRNKRATDHMTVVSIKRERPAANGPLPTTTARAARPSREGRVIAVRPEIADSAAANEAAPAAHQSSSVVAPSAAPKDLAAPARVPAVATPKRGANGRFLSRQERARNAAPDGDQESATHDSASNESGERRILSRLGDMFSGLRDSLGSMVSGTEQVDPAIAAAKEVSDIAAPLMAPIKSVGSLLFKPRDEKVEREKAEKKINVPWYRRLWVELRELNERPAGGAASSTVKLGGIGGMLMKLPGVGMLGKLLGSVGGALKPLLSLAGKAALPLAAMFSAVTSFSTSTEEYAQRLGIELDGSLAQELGVRFVGVLGDLGNTLTFGMAGKFGEYIAPAVSDMITKMVDRWDKTTSWVETKWSDMTSKFDAVIDGISKWFADRFGAVANKVKEVGAAVSNTAVEARASAGEWVGQKADAVASAFGGGSKGRSKAMRQALQAEMTSSGITDPREQAMFMAQMDHESGGFRNTQENLNYSAEGLMKTFPKYYKSLADAQKDARNPEAIANKVYGGRMGNTQAGDGFKFRGRGAIQLTGKDNYAAASKDLGIDLLGNPDLAADPAVAAKVATWYWKKNNLGSAARQGDVTAVTKRINGGTNGLADRQKKYKAYLAAANTGKLAIDDGRVVSATVTPTPSGAAGQTIADNTPTSTPSVPPLIAPLASPPAAPVRSVEQSGLTEVGLRAIQSSAARVTPAAPTIAATAPRIASAAPPADRMTVPPVPSVPRKVASNESKSPAPIVLEQPLSQNLSDRGLAQAATGGIGMNLGDR